MDFNQRVKMSDPAADHPAAAAIQYRTIPSAIFVKEYPVEHFKYLGGLLTDGHIDEMDLSDLILEHVKHGHGMTTSWELLEVEVTGRQDGYLTEIRLGGDMWWISPDQMILAVK